MSSIYVNVDTRKAEIELSQFEQKAKASFTRISQFSKQTLGNLGNKAFMALIDQVYELATAQSKGQKIVEQYTASMDVMTRSADQAAASLAGYREILAGLAQDQLKVLKRTVGEQREEVEKSLESLANSVDRTALVKDLAIADNTVKQEQAWAEIARRANETKDYAKAIIDLNNSFGDKNGTSDRFEAFLNSFVTLRDLHAQEQAIAEQLADTYRTKSSEVSGSMAKIVSDVEAGCERCSSSIEEVQDKIISPPEEDKKTRTFMDGLINGLNQYAESAADTATAIETTMGAAFSSMEDSMVSFVNTGKLEFTSLVDSMIQDIIRLTIRSSITGPLAAGLSAGISSLFSQSSSVLDMPNLFDNPSLTSQGSALIPPIYRSARGNAFTKGSGLQSYRNSVVSSPTYFAFARGGIPRIGLMGEKPGSPGEAILPLTRTSSGNLGVEAVTGDSGASPQVNITVNNSMANEAEVQVRQTPSANGGMDLELMVKRIYRSDVARGGIDGHLRSGGWKQRPVGH